MKHNSSLRRVIECLAFGSVFLYVNYLIISGNVSALLVQGIEIWQGGEYDLPHLLHDFTVARLIGLAFLILMLVQATLTFIKNITWHRQFTASITSPADVLRKKNHTVIKLPLSDEGTSNFVTRIILFLKEHGYNTSALDTSSSTTIIEGRRVQKGVTAAFLTKLSFIGLLASFFLSAIYRQAVDVNLAEGEIFHRMHQAVASRFQWPTSKSENLKPLIRDLLSRGFTIESVIFTRDELPAEAGKELFAGVLYAHVTYTSPEAQGDFLLGFFPPHRVKNTLFLNVSDFGFAPCMRIYHNNQRVFSKCVKMKLFPVGREDGFPLPGESNARLVFRLRAENDVIDTYSPAFHTTLYSTGGKVEGILKTGQTLALSSYTILLVRTIPWITLTFTRDAGLVVLWPSLIALMFSCVLYLVLSITSRTPRVVVLVMRSGKDVKTYATGTSTFLKKLTYHLLQLRQE